MSTRCLLRTMFVLVIDCGSSWAASSQPARLRSVKTLNWLDHGSWFNCFMLRWLDQKKFMQVQQSVKTQPCPWTQISVILGQVKILHNKLARISLRSPFSFTSRFIHLDPCAAEMARLSHGLGFRGMQRKANIGASCANPIQWIIAAKTVRDSQYIWIVSWVGWSIRLNF